MKTSHEAQEVLDTHVYVQRDGEHVTLLLSTPTTGHVLTLGMPEASDLAAALTKAARPRVEPA